MKECNLNAFRRKKKIRKAFGLAGSGNIYIYNTGTGLVLIRMEAKLDSSDSGDFFF